MHKHILVPTDGSELSEQAVDYGIALAKDANAKVTGITVTAPFHIFVVELGMVTDTPESYKTRMNTVAAKRLAYVKDAAAAAGVSCEVMHTHHEQPYQAIIDTATNRGCDLIVMASHGRRGVSAVVLGSETVKVLTHSTSPVLVYRGPRSKLSPYFAAS
jgi:nucleotide-binding universal stress UspA family protein